MLIDASFLFLGTTDLSSTAFRFGTEAVSTSDRIIFDTATGHLYWDFDGLGGDDQVLIVTLRNIGPNLTANDIEFF